MTSLPLVQFVRPVMIAAVLVGTGVLAACGPAERAGADAEGLALRVVIPDTSIRQPDVPCSGARAFRFAHPGAPYAVHNPDGRQVATGELPEGVATEAFTFDMGDARQPTVCVMMLDVAGVDSLDEHVLVIGDRRPLPIRPNPNLDDMPEVVLR
jgi:hypothetical protein